MKRETKIPTIKSLWDNNVQAVALLDMLRYAGLLKYRFEGDVLVLEWIDPSFSEGWFARARSFGWIVGEVLEG